MEIISQRSSGVNVQGRLAWPPVISAFRATIHTCSNEPLLHERLRKSMIWNPEGNQKFDVHGAWQVESVMHLLHDRRSLDEASIDIGPARPS